MTRSVPPCAFGLRGVWQERQRQTAVLRERQDTAEKLGDALALLRESRGRYLAAAQRVRDEKNDYETQKDLVSIAKDALDKRRAALAKAAAIAPGEPGTRALTWAASDR